MELLNLVGCTDKKSKSYRSYFEKSDPAACRRVDLRAGELSAAVRQTGSPFIVLLDRKRRVRYEGELTSVDLWDTLAAVNAEPA